MAQPTLIYDDPAFHQQVASKLAGDPDPYSTAMAIVVLTLEVVLCGDASARLGESERDILLNLAVAVRDADPAVSIRVEP